MQLAVNQSSKDIVGSIPTSGAKLKGLRNDCFYHRLVGFSRPDLKNIKEE